MQENREKFTAWITKYALTKGVFSVRVEDCFDISETMVKSLEGGVGIYYHGKDWHRTRKAAIERAEVMRKKRIKATKERLTKLENLRF